MGRLLKVGEVAGLLAIDKHAIYDMIKAGSIPSVRIGQRRLRVPAADLEAWVEQQKVTGVTQ